MRGSLVPLVVCGVVVVIMIRPLWLSFPTGAYILLGAYVIAALLTLGGAGVRAARRRRESGYYIRRR